MANSIAAADDKSLGGRIRSLPERIRAFIHDVRTEMKKVTSPSLKEVQATTVVVIIAVFIFAVYFWAIDNIIGRSIEQLFKYFTHR